MSEQRRERRREAHPVVTEGPRFVDYYGRPWAKNWEQYFEQGLEKPDSDVPAAVLDIFK